MKKMTTTSTESMSEGTTEEVVLSTGPLIEKPTRSAPVLIIYNNITQLLHSTLFTAIFFIANLEVLLY